MEQFFSQLPHRPSMPTASAVLSIDLAKPIDLSQMTVVDVSTRVVERKYGMGYTNEHTVTLIGYEDPDNDVIKVTIVRESVRRPDFKAIELASKKDS
ncbi:MAG TPA: hypothetical protein VK658_14710 [Chryseolinea sp.]|nr:hypothetical protein [Chryseolinea sp.]